MMQLTSKRTPRRASACQGHVTKQTMQCPHEAAAWIP